jgi:hypothetical protein
MTRQVNFVREPFLTVFDRTNANTIKSLSGANFCRDHALQHGKSELAKSDAFLRNL